MVYPPTFVFLASGLCGNLNFTGVPVCHPKTLGSHLRIIPGYRSLDTRENQVNIVFIRVLLVGYTMISSITENFLHLLFGHLLGLAIAYTADAPLYILQYSEVKFYIAEYMARKNENAKAIELITEQKWMAIFGQGVEAFAEIRRKIISKTDSVNKKAPLNGDFLF